MSTSSGYGLWSLVALNSVIFIFFAFSFTKPKTRHDWRIFGAFSAFIIALFTEMYGFPLTIFFFSGWLTEKYPGIDFLSHDNGHLLHTLLGFEGSPHFDPLHISSNVLIIAGLFMLSSAWKDSIRRFGQEYSDYILRIPAFVPDFKSTSIEHT